MKCQTEKDMTLAVRDQESLKILINTWTQGFLESQKITELRYRKN